MTDAPALSSELYLRARETAAPRGLALERAEFFAPQAEHTFTSLNSSAPNVRVEGEHNLVLVGARTHASRASIQISGSNNLVVIGAYARLGGGRISVIGDNSIFWFGAQSSADDITVMIREGQQVIIGDDCLFSARIIVETSDHHPIFDRGTGERLNGPGSVEIGDHVWLGRDVRVGKGAVIGAGSIVGQGAVVSGRRCAEPDGLYAGIPAKQIRENVEWAHQKAQTRAEYEASDYAANRRTQRAWLDARVGVS